MIDWNRIEAAIEAELIPLARAQLLEHSGPLKVGTKVAAKVAVEVMRREMAEAMTKADEEMAREIVGALGNATFPEFYRFVASALSQARAEAYADAVNVMGDLPLVVRCGDDAATAVSRARAELMDAIEAKAKEVG